MFRYVREKSKREVLALQEKMSKGRASTVSLIWQHISRITEEWALSLEKFRRTSQVVI